MTLCTRLMLLDASELDKCYSFYWASALQIWQAYYIVASTLALFKDWFSVLKSLSVKRSVLERTTSYQHTNIYVIANHPFHMHLTAVLPCSISSTFSKNNISFVSRYPSHPSHFIQYVPFQFRFIKITFFTFYKYRFSRFVRVIAAVEAVLFKYKTSIFSNV